MIPLSCRARLNHTSVAPERPVEMQIWSTRIEELEITPKTDNDFDLKNRVGDATMS
jgi:hypothetical protein